jgi:DNA-binding NtrC family response regulator
MVAALRLDIEGTNPFGLVVSGEAESWLPALDKLVGPELLVAYRVGTGNELLEVVEAGMADAAVLDEEVNWDVPVLQLLRMIRRLDAALPVVVVTAHTDRRWLEHALRLAAFSVLTKPLELEPLLRQIQRIMLRTERLLRPGPDELKGW